MKPTPTRMQIPFAGWLVAVLALPAAAQAAAPDPALERGERIAQSQCSACHVVAPVQEYPPILNPPAPAFADIANRPDSTAASLAHFVGSTHWDLKTMPMSMPSPELSKPDRAAVVRYILSLRKH